MIRNFICCFTSFVARGKIFGLGDIQAVGVSAPSLSLVTIVLLQKAVLKRNFVFSVLQFELVGK